jgi:hypothetical protein
MPVSLETPGKGPRTWTMFAAASASVRVFALLLPKPVPLPLMLAPLLSGPVQQRSGWSGDCNGWCEKCNGYLDLWGSGGGTACVCIADTNACTTAAAAGACCTTAVTCATTKRVVRKVAMDGVKSAMATWTFGGAGEGLQGLRNAPYSLPLVLAPLLSMPSPPSPTVRVLQRDFVS